MKKNSFRQIMKKYVSFLAALTLCITGSMPNATILYADNNSSSQYSQDEVDAIIDEKLSYGDYEEGEALVIFRNNPNEDSIGGDYYDALSNAESLMDIEEAAYNEYTDMSSEEAVDEDMVRFEEEDNITISYVVDKSKTTKELLTELYKDSRVLSAEPNYITDIMDEGDDIEEVIPFEAEDISVLEAEDISVSEDNEVTESELIISDEDIVIDEETIASDIISEEEDTDISEDTNTPEIPSDYSFVAPGDNTKAYDSSVAAKDATKFQWGYNNDGSVFSTAYKSAKSGFDINPPHWNDSESTNAGGIVAVMDTGIDYTNPDLKDVMYEVEPFTIEQVGGGKYGYNASDGDSTDPMDHQSHGTHCAGIIAASWDGKGISGAANGCKLLAVRISVGNTGSISTVATVKGYSYLLNLVKFNVEVNTVSCSWGSDIIGSDCVDLAITQLGLHGVVSTKASGNSNLNQDLQQGSATSMIYNKYNVTVDSMEVFGNKSSFSNYGATTTDVFAPGSNILSTVPVSMSNYIPELDPNPVYNEEDASCGQIIYEAMKSAADAAAMTANDINGITNIGTSNTQYGYCNNNCTALNFADGLNSPSANGNGFLSEFISYIPIDNTKKDDITYFGCCVASQSNVPNGSIAIVPYVLTCNDDGSEPTWTPLNNYYSNCSYYAWNELTYDIKAAVGNSNLYLINDNSNYVSYLPVAYVCYYQDAALNNSTILIDQVAIGDPNSKQPYAYMSGTSMATPAVAGLSSIIAESHDDGNYQGTTQKEAMERANILKGRVTVSEDLADYCRSGGYVDFNVSEETNYVPVINDIDLKKYGSEHVAIIHGAFFGGSGGTVTVNGNGNNNIIDWTDDEIICVLHDCDCNLGTIVVKGENGKSGRNAFVIETGDYIARGAYLFERNIELPGDHTTRYNSEAVAMTGLGNKMYFMFDNVHTEEYSLNDLKDGGGCQDLWTYDWKDGWNLVASLPVGYADVLLTNYNNNLLVYAIEMKNYGQQGTAYIPHIYLYDVLKNEFTEIQASSDNNKVYVLAGVTNVKDHLLVIGGGKEYSINASTGQYTLSGDNVLNISEMSISNGKYTLKTVKQIDNELLTNVSLASVGNDVYVKGSNNPLVPLKVSFNVTDVIKYSSYSQINLSEQNLATGLGYSATQYGLAATSDGPVFAGLYLYDSGEPDKAVDADTYILKKGSNTLSDIDRRAYWDVLMRCNAYAYDGMLYVAGFNARSNPSLMIKATKVNTPAKEKPVITLADKNAAYTGKAVSISNAKVVGPKYNIKYTYYTDAACTKKTTAANSGAASSGAAPVNVGVYYVVASVSADDYYETGKSSPAKLTVIPKGSEITSLSAVKWGFTVKYNKTSSDNTGYQIQCSTDSKFGSTNATTKSYTVSGYATVNKTIKELKANKTYYVRVRTYKTVNGAKLYSDWSSVKSVKIPGKDKPVIKLTAKTAQYSGKAISIGKATVTGPKEVTYTYYTDTACTKKTTAANSGAASNGAAPVKSGIYYVIASVSANDYYESGKSSPAKLTIVPKTVSITGLTAGKGEITVKYGKTISDNTGYQIQCSPDTKFSTKNTTSSTVDGYKTVSKKITKLNSQKKYYVRIRTYKTINGSKLYSEWSDVKNITTK